MSSRSRAVRVNEGVGVAVIHRRLAVAQDGGGDPVCSLEGHVDAVSPTVIEGWAFDKTRPGIPVRLEVLVDGALVAEVAAARFREDLAVAGLGTGRCAFVHRFEPALSPATDHVLTVRRGGDQAELFGSPFRLVARARQSVLLEGCIDGCSATAIDGWAFDPAAADVAVVLEVLVDGKVRGVAVAGSHRLDLQAAGKRDGSCAFRFQFRPRLSAQRGHVIEVRRASDQTRLAARSLVRSRNAKV